ncbi:tetratricopeptide repeat protein [Candidatus Poribacteria bacterium]|nr:tetratricopeptide repeat protein [Candidatus Poribacteria bacterium]MYF56346.1 tetratricopeptide repeat protein [Candidatus Poribacteria bacterium]
MYLNRITLSILLLITLLFYNDSTSAEECPLTLADHFTTLGNYEAAITEYKRFLFFHPEDVQAAKVYHKIGYAYREQGLWQEAILAMRNAVLHADDKDTKSEYQLNLAVILLASQNYDLARLELIRVALRNPSGTLHQRALFLQAVAFIYQFRWKEAQEILSDETLLTYATDERLDTLFNIAINQKKKSTRVAKVLSAILPGTGQIYAGNWRGGLNAFLLNGALGFVAVDGILDQNYLDAFMWTYYIFLRYYRGNVSRAGRAVDEFNENASRRAADNILKRLQTITETQ